MLVRRESNKLGPQDGMISCRSEGLGFRASGRYADLGG